MSSTTGDRAAGAVLGAACGDALGGGGGGSGAAVPVLLAAAAGESLTAEATQDAIVAAWAGDAIAAPTAAAARAAARTRSEGGGSAGAAALLLAAPVALPFVQSASAAGLVRAATRLSGLVDAHPLTAEACVLWSGAIRHAVRTGEADLRAQLALLPDARRPPWAAAIDEAEALPPEDLQQDGGVVRAVQAAWSAIARTPVPERLPGTHLRLALDAALRAGGTGVVAALAGGLLGARWGASAIPVAWRRALREHGGLSAGDLVRGAVLAANGGLGDGSGWPAVERMRPAGPRVLVPHPHDDGVLLGSLAALDGLAPDVDAVVSLCRVGRRQTDREQVELRLVDAPGRNPNLDLVLRDAADAVAALRAEGRRVLVHGAEGRSRTAAVGALYSALHLGVRADTALTEVTAALPAGAPSPFLQEAVLRIGEEAAAARPRPVLLVALDALVDVASGLARLPDPARAAHSGRADGSLLLGLSAPLPGAIAAVRRLAEAYDVALLAPPPGDDAAAVQRRLDWVRVHLGTDDGGPAAPPLILADPRMLDRGAVLVEATAAAADGFEGERVRIGEAPLADWAAVADHLLAPERTGVGRRAAPGGRSRDRVVGRPSLTTWVLEALRARGGSASVVQVARDVWEHHEDELRRSGDLLFTWQHDLRRVAAILRDQGRLAPSADGVWRLAR